MKLIVNVPAEELAVTFVGVPGALEDPPVVTDPVAEVPEPDAFIARI